MRILRTTVVAVALTAALSWVAVSVARAFGTSVSPWGTAGLAGAVVVIGYTGSRLRTPAAVVRPPAPAPISSRPFARLVRIRERLRDAERPGRFEDRIRPLLVEFGEDRLRRNHGIDWRVHPDEARALVGEELWSVLRGDEVSSPGIEKVDAIVRRIEQL